MLTQQEMRTFTEQGFVILRNRIPLDAIRRLQDAATATIDAVLNEHALGVSVSNAIVLTNERGSLSLALTTCSSGTVNLSQRWDVRKSCQRPLI